jgi:hypothetical protein
MNWQEKQDAWLSDFKTRIAAGEKPKPEDWYMGQ